MQPEQAPENAAPPFPAGRMNGTGTFNITYSHVTCHAEVQRLRRRLTFQSVLIVLICLQVWAYILGWM